MTVEIPVREGQVLSGPLFSEPMQVETVRANGLDVWVAGLVGQQSERFRQVTLTSDDISNLAIADPARFSWREVSKVQRYWLSVDALKQPMEVRDSGRSKSKKGES